MSLPPTPSDALEPKTKLEKTVSFGQQIFDEVSALGVGRFYSRTEKMLPPKASSSDILGRIEALSNPESKPSIEISLPMAVSLPVNIEETKHVIIFANGDMALVEPRLNQIKDYQSLFATTSSGGDNVMLSVMESKAPVASLKTTESLGYSVIDPINSDKNENLVLDALKAAKETALIIKEQQEERKERFQKSALTILQG